MKCKCLLATKLLKESEFCLVKKIFLKFTPSKIYKTRIMKTLVIFLLFVATLSVRSQFTRQEAITAIVEDVVGADSLDSHLLYSKYSMMYDGDTLWIDVEGYYLCPFQENWIFFVDDMPDAFWAHPCRIIFYDAFSGNFQVYQDIWPPLPYLSNNATFLLEWEWITEINPVDNPFQITKDKIEIYPNPFTENFSIAHLPAIDGDLTIQLMDYTGKIVIELKTFSGNSITIDARNLESGIYLLLVSCEGQLIGSEKVVKND